MGNLVQINYEVKRSSGKTKRKKIEVPRGFQINKFGSRSVTRLDRSKVSRWSDESRILRSVVFDRNQDIVSVGLPKFFDYTKDFGYRDQAVEQGFDAWVKYDGSLLIRYVDRDKVVFRTRNTLATSDLVYEATVFAEKNYPELLDPSWGQDFSIHFEYLNPKRELVIPIESEDLVLIGAAENKLLQTLTPEEALEDIPGLATTGVTPAEKIVSDCHSIEELQKTMSGREIEGAVLRFDRGQKMLRVKTEFYRELSDAKKFRAA